MIDPPESLGPYRIVGVLGSGSAGVIYRGQHRDTAEVVALKRVRMSEVQMLECIRREVHTLARIRHPGIVRILDQGVQDALPWFAMELLEGPTLRQYVDSHRPAPLNAVLTLVRRLCEPLAYLHGEGIVHRDLKPENVLVRRGEGKATHHHDSGVQANPEDSTWMDAQPVIMDFGLVWRFTDELSREILDVSGAAVGTVYYMAPEQARGELVDARADLYALGCILYELLTGRPPFLGESAVEILRRHLDDEPRPPSQLAQGVPPALDQLVLRLLAKQPRARIAHADDVAAALARLGAGNGDASMVPRPRAYLYRPGFMGRDSALREMDKRLEHLEAEHRGGVVLVGGESGVGKTRLLLEVARLAARRELRVLAGEALDVGSRPLEALRKPLRALADHCRARGVQETERLLGHRGRVLELYEPALAELPGQQSYPSLVDLPAPAAQLRLYTDLLETLGALGGIGLTGKPRVVLLLDDLQWADELTLGFLEFLLRAGILEVERAAPLLVVGTFRAEEVRKPMQSLLQAAGVHKQAPMHLERLDEEAVGAMVGEMLALDEAPLLFVRYLRQQSEGNPFFVAEVLRTAVAEGLLYRDGEGRWQVAEPAEREATAQDYEALPLPQSLRELVARRLKALTQPALDVSQVVAVCGREVDMRLIQRLLGVEEPMLLDALSELLHRQILEEIRPGTLRFVHDKFREVTYDHIDVALRPALHRAAAEGIEVLLHKESHLGALARHWEQAGERSRAREYCLLGARTLKERYVHDEAERLYRSYLRLTEAPSAESIAVRNELALGVLAPVGRAQEAATECERTLREARELGEASLEAESLRGLGRQLVVLGQLDEARSLFEQALGLHRTLGDRLSAGIALRDLGELQFRQGLLQEADELYEQALVLHRSVGDRRSEGNTLGSLAVLRKEQGRITEALTLYETAMSLHREMGNRAAEASTLGNIAAVWRYLGRADMAVPLFEQALALHRETGSRVNEAITLNDLATVYFDQGEPQEALVLFQQALEIYRRVGDLGGAGIALNNLAGIQLELGRPAEAQVLYEHALGLHRKVNNRRSEGNALVGLARLERLCGRELEKASGLIRDAETILRQIGNRYYLGMCLCERAHLVVAEGSNADRVLAEARELAAPHWLGPDTELGGHIVKVQRAVERAKAGRPVFRGECVEDLPPGLRRWLELKGDNL